MSKNLTSNLISTLLDMLAVSLKPHGFRMVKSKKWFVRLQENRTDKFQLVVLEDKDRYRIRPSACIRFDKIESIFHKTSGYQPEYQRETPTLGIDLWRVFGKEGFEVSFGDVSEVSEVVSQLMTIFCDKAIPYYSQFADISDVDAAVNNAPNEPCIHRGMPWLRASTGIIAAKLIERTDYQILANLYRETLRKDSNGFYLSRFESLLADLAAMKD